MIIIIQNIKIKISIMILTSISRYTYKMSWIEANNSNIIYTRGGFKAKKKKLILDLDGTLIKTKSGNKFPISRDDWILYSDNVISYLTKYNKKGYSILIITNQLNLDKNEKRFKSFKGKIEDIADKICLPMKILVSMRNDQYRKPRTGFIECKLNDRCIFVGDAAGRIGDHSDTDVKFALNLGLQFQTPEMFFLKKKKNFNDTVDYPELYATDTSCSDKKTIAEIKNLIEKQQIIILTTGVPGSGKSTLSRRIKSMCVLSKPEIYGATSNIKKIKESIKTGKSIIIDCVCSSIKSREKYIKIAKIVGLPIYSLLFDVNIGIAKHNNWYRYIISHNKDELVPDIAYRLFNKHFKKPTKKEGFSGIFTLKNLIKEENVDSKLYNKYYY